MSETTATLLIGPSHEWFAGRMFRAAHLLVLDEGERACWRVIPLDAADATSQLEAGRPERPRRWTVSCPDAPQHLLAHGLLAFLAVAFPEALDDPALNQMVRRARHARLTTSIADEAAAARVFGAMPGNAQVVLTVLPGSSIHPLDTAGLVSAEVPVVTAIGESVPA